MYFIKIATQKALLVIHSKNFKIGFCTLLVGIILAGYFGYASIPKVQVDQKNLSEKYDELAFQHVYSLTEFEGLPHNSSIILSQLTDLQIKYDNLTFKYNTLQAGQSTLDSQYHILQSQYSSLQTEYLNFLAEYQKLQPVTDFSYLVFTDGEGNYYAENGTTRVVDYSGTSGSQVGQFCIDALNVSGGKIVFVGEIALESPLEIQKGTSTGLMEISGLGPSTQLIVGQSSDGIRIVGEHAFGYGGPYHVVIKDLVLTTETFPEGKFMNYGIYIKNWFGVDVENVMVFYANKSGILIEDSADIQLDNVYVEGGTGTEYGGIEALDGVGFCLKGNKDCYLNNCLVTQMILAF